MAPQNWAGRTGDRLTYHPVAKRMIHYISVILLVTRGPELTLPSQFSYYTSDNYTLITATVILYILLSWIAYYFITDSTCLIFFGYKIKVSHHRHVWNRCLQALHLIKFIVISVSP